MKKIYEQGLYELNSLVEDMIKEMMNEGGENVPTVDDFFMFLANDPHAYTFAYAYYAYPAKVNKYMNGMPRTDDNLNPMFGKLLKSALIKFRWGETYADAMTRVDPEWEPSRASHYEQHPEFKVLKLNSKGEEVVPIVPEPYSGDFGILQDDRSIKRVSKEEVEEYLAPASTWKSSSPFIPMRKDRIFQLSAGRLKWKNPDCKYPYFGPKAPAE